MTNFKKLFAAGAALTMAFGMTALTACGPEPKDFTFEAEEATLTENDDGVACYQEAVEYGAEADADPTCIVGYFTAEGANIIWTIQSSNECDATLTLRAASASADASGLWTGGKGYIKEMDMSSGEYCTLTVNDTEVALTGVLPGLEFTPAADFSNFMDFYGSYMNNYKTVTANIHLKKGENKIVLTSLGYNDGTVSYGINVDKITINAASELTWTAEDNTDRVPPAMG